MKHEDAEAIMTAAGWDKPAAAFDPRRKQWNLWWGNRIMASAPTLRDALTQAGLPVPPVTRYTNVKASVLLGGDTVASCRSVTMARRIANALNSYEPNDRGV